MARLEIRLPDLGIDSPATVGMWLAKRGCRVRAGDSVVEVLTGPAMVELPSPVNGVLVEKLVGEDEPVAVGQVLAVIETEDESL